MGFYGIGPNVVARLLSKLSIHDTARVESLSTAKTTALSIEFTKMLIESDLRKKVQDDIRRLKDIGTYRGRRHAMGLPVRGVRMSFLENYIHKAAKVVNTDMEHLYSKTLEAKSRQRGNSTGLRGLDDAVRILNFLLVFCRMNMNMSHIRKCNIGITSSCTIDVNLLSPHLHNSPHACLLTRRQCPVEPTHPIHVLSILGLFVL